MPRKKKKEMVYYANVTDMDGNIRTYTVMTGSTLKKRYI